MPQFRLTQKFAIDCKIKNLQEPTVTTHPLDELKEIFEYHALPMLVLEVDKLFSELAIFTKTVDKKILGYMNDFFPVDWHETIERINNMPTKGDNRDWLYPIERFNLLLDINLPKNRFII